jgi:hypothetical protein
MANIDPITTRKTPTVIPTMAPVDIDAEGWSEEDEDEASVWVGAELETTVIVA